MNIKNIGSLLFRQSSQEKEIVDMAFKRSNKSATPAAPAYDPADDIAAVKAFVPVKPGKPRTEYSSAKDNIIKNLGSDMWDKVYAEAYSQRKAQEAPAETKRNTPTPSNAPRFEVNGVWYTLDANGKAVVESDDDDDDDDDDSGDTYYDVPTNGYPTKVGEFKAVTLRFFKELDTEMNSGTDHGYQDMLIAMASSLELELKATLGGSIAHIRPVVWVVAALLSASEAEISDSLLATEKHELARRKASHE